MKINISWAEYGTAGSWRGLVKSKVIWKNNDEKKLFKKKSDTCLQKTSTRFIIDVTISPCTGLKKQENVKRYFSLDQAMI